MAPGVSIAGAEQCAENKRRKAAYSCRSKRVKLTVG